MVSTCIPIVYHFPSFHLPWDADLYELHQQAHLLSSFHLTSANGRNQEDSRKGEERTSLFKAPAPSLLSCELQWLYSSFLREMSCSWLELSLIVKALFLSSGDLSYPSFCGRVGILTPCCCLLQSAHCPLQFSLNAAHTFVNSV